MKRTGLLAVTLVLLGASCAPDPLDTYAAPAAEAPPATRALPTTTATTEPDVDASDASIEPEVDPTFEPNGETAEVRSLDNSFIQQDLRIEAGTEVIWINGGRNDHNIMPVDESATWGVARDTFVPGSEYAHLFDTPGVFAYYCSIHGTTTAGMIGAITVNEPS